MWSSPRAAADQLRARLCRADEPTTLEVRAVVETIAPRELDTWLDRLWDVDPILDDEPLPRGCVPYLPCEAASLLAAIDEASIGADDVFVDIGAGIGRAAFFVHLLTGADARGLEIQPTLVEAARWRAEQLHRHGLRFVEGDVLDRIDALDEGTVFFMYCPFGRDRVDAVLDALRRRARASPIRICTVGMPDLVRPWLTPVPTTEATVNVYRGEA